MKKEREIVTRALCGAAGSTSIVDGANLKDSVRHGDKTQASVVPLKKAADLDLARLCALVRDARTRGVAITHERDKSAYGGASQGSDDSIVSWSELEMENTQKDQ